ncbi:hypothetical protein [Mycoplasma sp. OR1901]|uniref:hypothetical protein n=1 Tax=Mycoplasma sp. OR1901 TaxID=2742195 RepID=UPI0015823C40|nr:hypothetical protein [Mycoplasma sp. OR1901]QKT05163.1 hypothetical protein HTZ87_00310 [Mycoplasma sp. OR1901]
MKKVKKIFILGANIMSIGLAPLLISCSSDKTNQNVFKNKRTTEENQKSSTSNNEKIKEESNELINKINESSNSVNEETKSNSNQEIHNNNDLSDNASNTQDENEQTTGSNQNESNHEVKKETKPDSEPNPFDNENLTSNVIKFSNSNSDLNIELKNPLFYVDLSQENILNSFRNYAIQKDEEFKNIKSFEAESKNKRTQNYNETNDFSDFTISYNKDSNELDLTFDNSISASEIRVMIKSTNYLMPYSKIFTSKRKEANKFVFDLNELPKHINNFIITSYASTNNAYSLSNNPKYEFAKEFKFNSLNLDKFNAFRKNDQLYGSIKFNIDETNKDYLYQKTFALTFSPVLNNQNDVFKRQMLFPPRVIYVKNYQLDKFELNKLFKHVEYKLDKIEILEGDSKIKTDINVNLENAVNNIFVDNLALKDYDDNYFLSRNQLIAKNQVDYTYKDNSELSQLVDSQLDTYFNFTFENNFNKYDFNYEKQNLNILKDGERYKLIPFLGKDYVRNNYFKLSENNTIATLGKRFISIWI